jgi:hypothetical protein
MAKIDEMNELKEKWQSPVENFKSGLFEFLFRPASETLVFKAGNYLILGVAYLGGVFHWAWLINYGRVHVKYMDWEMFFNCYEVIQRALVENVIPYFMPFSFKGTNQFLAFPSTDLFPTIFLLKFFSVEEFFLFQIIFAYSLGFVGCLWLKKTYQWSLFTFLFFFLIFNFNGHVVSHIAIGHWPWISYFMLSFFAVWVFKLVEGDLSVLHGTRLSWVFFAMLLFGGLHTFVWCLIFLLLLCLCQKKFWKPVVIGVGLSLIFSLCRLLPAAVTFFGYENEFISGFPSASVFWNALTSVEGGAVLSLGLGNDFSVWWWEVDHYIGIIGLGVIMYFGVFLRLTKKNEWGINDYRMLNIPMLILTIFTFGSLYKLFAVIPIPFISVERVSTRFLIIPLLILLVVSCVWMQQMFNRLSARWSVMLIAVVGIFIQGFLFIKHSAGWHVNIWGNKLANLGVTMDTELSSWAKSVEVYYVPVVQISYLISLIAIVAFVAVSLYFNKRRLSLQKVDEI